MTFSWANIIFIQISVYFKIIKMNKKKLNLKPDGKRYYIIKFKCQGKPE